MLSLAANTALAFLSVVVLAAARASAADGVLVPRAHGPGRGYHGCVIDETTFGDFVLDAQLRRSSAVTHYGLLFRYIDEQNLYRLVLRTGQRDFRIEKVVDGASDYRTARYVHFPSQANRWYSVRLSAVGSKVRVWIDGALLYENDGFTERAEGLVGVTVFDPAQAEYDDVVVRAADGDLVLFRDDFDDGDCVGWHAVGTREARGVWDVQEKADRQPPARDFEVTASFQAAPASGPNRTMFEFPSLLCLRDGRLFTVFVEENQHGTPPWAAMPSSGKLWCAWSDDLGGTWTKKTLFVDTPVDDRHGYVTELPDGDLLASFWVQLVAFGVRGLLNYMTLSEDGGVTWSDPWCFRSPNQRPNKPGVPQTPGSCSVTVPARLHTDGRLYLPVATCGHDGSPPSEAGLLWSADGGRTWGEYVTIAFDAERRTSFCEPAVVCTPSGKWIAVMRTEMPINPGTTHPYKLGPTMWSTSPDGRTWSPARTMPLAYTHQGSTAPFLLQTATGVVVFAVNTGLAFSYDDGRTWVPQELQCGYYPVLTEVAPGTLTSLACGMGGKVIRLTKPVPGDGAEASATPVPQVPPPVTLPDHRLTPVHVDSVLGTPRAVRLRGPLPRRRSALVRPDAWPLLCVFAAETPRGHAVACVFGDGERTEWSKPLLLERTSGEAQAVWIGAARNGDLLLVYSVRTPEGSGTSYVASSRDGASSWTPARELRSPVPATGWMASGDPISMGDGGWLLPCTAWMEDGTEHGVLLSSRDNGDTWHRQADAPAGLLAPSLAVTRDGRWLVLGSTGRSGELAWSASADRGATWSETRATGLRGGNVAVVELLESFVVAGFVGQDGQLAGAITWGELDCWLARPIACGHLVRIAGRKLIALGSGTDLAGEVGRQAQVPLDLSEKKEARRLAGKLVPVTDAAFRLEGEWAPVEDATGVRLRTEGHHRAHVRFAGSVLFLVHAQAPDGHILRVTVDGEEYPPVDTRGSEAYPVSTCLAADLPPGEHELELRPLMPWQNGNWAIGGIEIESGEQR